MGQTLYLRVEGLQPSWRQAVVLTSKRGGAKLQLAVRVTNRELEADEQWKSLSYFELQSEKFILVEGDISRTRRSCAMPYRALEVSAELVLQKGLSLLGDDDLQFATASEEIDEEKKKKVELESSGSGESSSEESEGDALLRLLEKAKSSKADLATSSERKGKASGSRRRSSRFPFLDEKSSDKTSEEPDFTEMLKKMVASGSQESMGQQLNTLVQMEILRTLKDKGKKSNKQKTSGSEEDSPQSESQSSSEEVGKLRGAGRAMQAYRKGKKQMQKHPVRHIRRYVKEIEQQMGATEGSAYRLSDYTKKLAWGKHRSLMRVHYAVSEALEQLLNLKGKTKLAGLQLVQLLRGIHQCSLDAGDWKTAWLLLHLPDPVERPRFGGEVQELEVVASYVKAMNELERKSRALNSAADRTEEEPEGGKGKKGRGKKKQQQSEENVNV